MTVSRGRIHYVEAGQGPPLVLLHGWPGFWFDYRYVIPDTAKRGRTIAPDFLGFGDSSAVPEQDPAGADESAYARDVSELLARLEIRRAVFVGHDIGSAVAPALARMAPELVAGLVLLNPTHPFIGKRRFSPEAQREAWYQHFHVLPLAARLIDGDAARTGAYLTHFYKHWAGKRQITDEDLDTVIRKLGGHVARRVGKSPQPPIKKRPPLGEVSPRFATPATQRVQQLVYGSGDGFWCLGGHEVADACHGPARRIRKRLFETSSVR